MIENRRAFVVVVALALFAICLTTSCVPYPSREYYFAPVRGIVTRLGRPLVGAVVERSYNAAGETIMERTTTTARGEFAFPAASRFSLISWLGEPTIVQLITIEFQGIRREGWRFTKGNLERNGEVGGTLEIDCDFDSEAVHRRNPTFSWMAYDGICVARKPVNPDHPFGDFSK